MPWSTPSEYRSGCALGNHYQRNGTIPVRTVSLGGGWEREGEGEGGEGGVAMVEQAAVGEEEEEEVCGWERQEA